MEYERAFVCAPSNVAIAGLYARMILDKTLSDQCSLCIPPDRTPPGTPCASNDPNARIVCSTLSSRAGPLLDAQSFDLILLDEAAQCSEACSWTLLRSDVKTLVLVGDVLQLPAVTLSESAREAGHGRSMMERLVTRLGYPRTELRVQHRMHPAISEYPNRAFYGGTLEDATEVCDDAHDADALVCHRVLGSAEERDGTSVCNWKERARRARLPDDTWSSQKLARPQAPATAPKWSSSVRTGPSVAPCSVSLQGCAVHTVDSFQGREADTVVLSLCRTGKDTHGGFWADPRRLNVALTRAKRTLEIVGSFDWSERAATLHSLMCDAESRGRVCEYEEADNCGVDSITDCEDGRRRRCAR